MQGIEYHHHDTSNNGNGYDSSHSQITSSSESGLLASLNGFNRHFDDGSIDNSNSNITNDNYLIGNGAFHSVAPAFSDSKSMDRSMTDMGEYNNDNGGDVGGGCNGSAEAWWTKNKTSLTCTVADATTSTTTTTSSTANTTRTSLGPRPGPSAETNRIDRSYSYNNCSAGDHSARATFINSSGGTCANEHNFDELTSSNHEHIVGINNGSYNYGNSDGIGYVNASTTTVIGRGDGRIVSDSRLVNYNKNNNSENGISNSRSSGISIGTGTGTGNSAAVTASNLSSSLSSSLSLLPTPPLTATGTDSLRLSSGSAPRFGGFGEAQNQSHNQHTYQQQGQNLFQHAHQQQHQQSQHTQDNQLQQAQSFHSSTNQDFKYQPPSQQHYGQQVQQHQTQQIDLEQQQQDQYNRTTSSAPQSQEMTPVTQAGVMPTTNGVTTKSAISVACMWCRSKHLKCDGGVRCSRCQAEGFVCSYPKSRRGFKGPRKAKALLSARRHDSMTQGK